MISTPCIYWLRDTYIVPETGLNYYRKCRLNQRFPKEKAAKETKPEIRLTDEESLRRWLAGNKPGLDADQVIKSVNNADRYARRNHLAGIRLMNVSPLEARTAATRLLASRAFQRADRSGFNGFKKIVSVVLTYAEWLENGGKNGSKSEKRKVNPAADAPTDTQEQEKTVSRPLQPDISEQGERQVPSSTLPDLEPALQAYLQDDLFAELREALRRNGVLKLDEFTKLNPWVFMNRHAVYNIGQRQSVYSVLLCKTMPEKESEAEGAWQLKTDKKVYNGNTPAEALLKYCRFISQKYPLRFRELIGRRYNDKGSVVLMLTPGSDDDLKMSNPTAYINCLTSDDAALVYAKWICIKCRDDDKPVCVVQKQAAIPQKPRADVQEKKEIQSGNTNELPNKKTEMLQKKQEKGKIATVDEKKESGKKEIVNRMTIKDAVVAVLQEAMIPLTISEILQRIEVQQFYRFNSENPSIILYHVVRNYCRNMHAPHHSPQNLFDRFKDKNGQIRYMLIDGTGSVNDIAESHAVPVDNRWLPILKESFPDGYILDDFLSRFQAAGFWQERYAESCPITEDDIDEAMIAVGTVRDGRVFFKNEENNQLITAICNEILSILHRYTSVYRSCIYDRYHDQLAVCQIYTEQVMTGQLLKEARGRFYSVNLVFAKPGQYASVIQDCRKVLRDHGGPMHVGDVAKELWFIPYDMVYHYLSVDDETLNVGSSTWMLAEHFPLAKEDALKIEDMLNKYFLVKNYIQAFDLMPLLQKKLPSIAENLIGLTYMAVFNIIAYYLKDRFSFSKAIISPKGASIDFTDLFRLFASEHETFTLDELGAFASELKLPIYWESVFAGGAVRVSKTEFVNQSLIHFDVDEMDRVLEELCPGDYLPIQAISSAMMMHLPSCGYKWNGYLLLSYVQSFSNVFRLSYNSLGKTGFYGAMVRKGCKEITIYSSLIERVLTDDNTWATSEDALELLVKQGYQASRKYKSIDAIVEKVRQKKQMEGE